MNYELLEVSTISEPVVYLLDNLRYQDLVEFRSMHQTDDLHGLVDSVLKESCWSALLSSDGIPCLLFGLTPDGKGGGCPWLVATDRLETNQRLRRDLVRKSGAFLALMHETFDTLWNDVHKDNLVSRKWLSHLGFEQGQPVGDFIRYTKKLEKQ